MGALEHRNNRKLLLVATQNPPTATTFTRLLAERPVLIADGGMGTSLFALGMEPGACPELLNVENPDMIREAQKGFLDAGSDIILTNTFGGTRRRLALHKLEDRVAELNLAAVAILKELTAQYDRPIAIAGSVGPTGDLFVPLGPLDHETAVEAFTEQIEALIEGGVDVIWIETLSSREELDAAYEAASKFSLPIVTTMSFDTNGKTMMGFSPEDLADWTRQQEVAPAAVGANCGVGAGDVIVAVQELAQARPNVAIVSKANCGLPSYTEGHLDYPHGPDTMGDYVELAMRAGARIIGACCGSSPDHIRAIVEAADQYRSAQLISREEIADRLWLQAQPEVDTSKHRPRRRRRAAVAE